MSMLSYLARRFGMHPILGLHDLDLPDEPGNGTDSVDPVSRRELLGQYTASTMDWPVSVAPCVDGPAVTSGEASAAGHPIVDWDAIREGVAELRTVLVDALAWLDEIDPTPAGLTTATVNNEHNIDIKDLSVMSIQDFQKRMNKRRKLRK